MLPPLLREERKEKQTPIPTLTRIRSRRAWRGGLERLAELVVVAGAEGEAETLAEERVERHRLGPAFAESREWSCSRAERRRQGQGQGRALPPDEGTSFDWLFRSETEHPSQWTRSNFVRLLRRGPHLGSCGKDGIE